MSFKKTVLACMIGAAAASALLPASVSAETLRIGYSADPETLDLHEQLSGGMLRLSHLAFDPLVRWTKDFDFEPRLASDWEQVDETTLRMTLREGVTFHTGNAFTAEDVVWTIERLQQSPDYRAIFEPIAEAHAVDAHTLEITTHEPYPLLLNLATYIFPLDREFYTGTTDTGQDKAQIVKAGNSFASRHLSGTGPFVVTERRQGVRVEFERFADYWDEGSEGNVSRIVLTPIAENAARVAALLSGGVDFIDAVPPNDLDRVRQAQGVDLVEISGTRIIGFQLNEERVEAFRDPRVRQAVAYAINQEGIADRLMRGFATPAAQFSPSGYSGHNPELPPRYDLERAGQLMEEAGYADGFGIDMIAPNNRYVNDAQIAQAIANMLARINIDVNLRTMPLAQYWPEYDTRSSDAAMIGWHADTEDSANFFQYLTACIDAETGAGQYNYGGYCNTELDALVARADGETDMEARNAMLRDAEAMLHEDAGFVMLHWQNLAYGAREGVAIEPVVNATDFPYLGDLVIGRD
ncbi:ABC transporter substrate-binding protein [Halomonas heilongjiangensis]|uniref:Nickel/dipeptide/oligopeptide ABC transporter substrate-binding protein n=1 Tax=Halomonas heilongjiangensis TaxID=1387883 RepID=A0A2N7TR43_9GAMM|nr:ABC transporter substrate-binding protein [Halomonas heilongjiangensis]PMR70659.1 nickel/dipeptide/oligopeptide ABC transporter substrate-binding protein [Halomonas heilongjiangensis]PXX88786.1 nickel/dipeptide/oligopeptide ABC transporter substrate-binding protein [Halomonas heilongjiangensis]